MLWELTLRSAGRDPLCERARQTFDLLTQSQRGHELIHGAARGYLLEGDLSDDIRREALLALLVDPVVEEVQLSPLDASYRARDWAGTVTIIRKPGVMDPPALTVQATARDLGLSLVAVRTFRRYTLSPQLLASDRDLLFRKVLANLAIEQVIEGPVVADHLTLGRPYEFRRVELSLLNLDDAGLQELSRAGQLALDLAEMRTVQAHFRAQGREPTDAELESIAQTWSEHCSHKTLKGRVEFTHHKADGTTETRHYQNLLKETIFAATVEVRRQLGPDDWCVSVFVDNAGVVQFDADHHVCFKVETHNRPSAIEPYAGATTGLGGVIRDVLGTGRGAKPVANTDVFCFAPPDTPADSLPPGVLHPRTVMDGVIAGVRDYGNRMGIPTVNGAIVFDERYLANPLVFCGTVGVMPKGMEAKQVSAGDLIVALGGRTGRDGIHGATFSSLSLSAASETEGGGAVQLGNAITQKKLLDVLLGARDLGLYAAVTDCGAGGFSSAVGEMGADLGAAVHLDRAPLKYEGLSYTEIWISEAQERMVLAVPPARWPELQRLCASEDVEAADLGTFEATGRLRLYYRGETVADLDMHFLHDGRPTAARRAEHRDILPASTALPKFDANDTLKRILAAYSVCSKESVVRVYDHEVQGGSVIKPLVGVRDDGPGDAAVITPVPGRTTGLAIACGLNPRYGDLDPYAMAQVAIDEAVRNLVAVGADPSRIALLDNFCYGNTDRPEVLGHLVRAAEGCRDAAIALGLPFISGKDSLKNEYRGDGRHIVIPGTLLISAFGIVHDVRQCVTMDLKAIGNELYLIGETRGELGGSHFDLIHGATGCVVPSVNLPRARRLFAALHHAIRAGTVRACHDLSEGGLAVAAAEMAFAGDIGADLKLPPLLPDAMALFGESATRWLVEVEPARAAEFREGFFGLPYARLGTTVRESRLRIAGAGGEWIVWAGLSELRESWQRPLRTK